MNKMFNQTKNLVLSTTLLLFGLVLLSQNPTIPTYPTIENCNIGKSLTSGVSVNIADTYSYNTIGVLSNISINGGILVVCGDLSIISGNFNSGTIYIKPNSKLFVGQSVSVVGVNIINLGFVELRANNMNFNTTTTIWNMGDSLVISGNGTHIFNNTFITTNGAKTNIESNASINSGGYFFVDNNSYVQVEGSMLNNGSLIINESATLNIGGSYTSNSSGQIYMDDYSLFQVSGNFTLNHTISYNGTFFLGAMVVLESTSTINVPISQDILINVCTPQSLTNTQLGNATSSCDNLSIYGYNGLIPLPIQLGSFEAVYVNEYVLIKWITLGEINSSHFVLESSFDLSNWVTVSVLQSLGNSSVGGKYEVVDVVGAPYYRLKQFDFDGHFEFFGPISIYKNTDYGHVIEDGVATIKHPGIICYRIITTDGKLLNYGVALGEISIKLPNGLSVLIINEAIYLKVFR